jgi:hypothetical protein
MEAFRSKVQSTNTFYARLHPVALLTRSLIVMPLKKFSLTGNSESVIQPPELRTMNLI